MSPRSLSLRDAVGTRHEPAGPHPRIVSLVPSITELLFDLGLGDAVVGRTAFCVHPEDRVRSVRSVGGTKQVRMERLRKLEPTHVIVNVDETPRQLARDLEDLGYSVVVTHPIDVRDNLALFRLIGGLFGRSEAAGALCAKFETAYARIAKAARRWPRRRVLYLIWKDPWMTVARDTYISRTLALANWHTLPDGGTVRYPAIELCERLVADVDLVLFGTEPFPFKERHLDAFRADFPTHAAKALLIDAQMVSWYGSRAIAGLDYLADLAEHFKQ